EANLERAREFFREGKLRAKFVYHSGDALKSFAATRGKFDIILNDIDKQSYPTVARRAVPRLKRGGLLISDNMIRDGKVLRGARDAATDGVRDYTHLVYQDKRLFTTIVPLRDGVAVSLKR
ncbi:MAG TPA: hypothetical protein VLB27_07665, partial [candidate division Zixibacteria bacterium]|nr:hypothetical protein [candidate division Zixibacteria bacterium]